MTIDNFVAYMPRLRLTHTLLAGLLLAAICGAISAQENIPTYTEAYIGDVQRLNPLLAPPNSTEAAIATLLFEGLFTLNRFGEVVPQLAQESLVSADGLEYVVWLRGHSDNAGQYAHPPARWHDGLPVTAADIAYTMSLLRARDFPGDPRLGAFWRTVETTVLSDYALRFRLTQPLASFRDALRIAILPEHALRGATAADLPSHPFNLDPIGSGPYQLEAIRSDDGARVTQVDLRRAPNYAERAAAPYALERISFRRYEDLASVQAAFAAGAIDGYASRHFTERAELLETPTAIHSALAPQLGLLLFQWKHEALAEVRVRRALVEGLDVPSLITNALPNLAVSADGPLPTNSWAYVAPPPAPPYDAAAARERLAISLPDTDSDGYRLTLRLLLPNAAPPQRALAQGIAASWALLDVRVEIDARPNAEYAEALAARDFDIALIELDFSGSADPDVYTLWHEGQIETGQNFGAVTDRRISQSLERARQDENVSHRRALYAEFQRAFAEAAAAIPLYSPLFTYGIAPDISGVQLGYLDAWSVRFREIGHWSRAAGDGS